MRSAPNTGDDPLSEAIFHLSLPKDTERCPERPRTDIYVFRFSCVYPYCPCDPNANPDPEAYPHRVLHDETPENLGAAWVLDFYFVAITHAPPQCPVTESFPGRVLMFQGFMSSARTPGPVPYRL